MLSLLFIYFIGKAFYDLAENHSKNRWLFAVLGVISYYVGTVVAGILLGIYYAFNDPDSIATGEFENSALSYFVLIPAGLLTCWIFYRILKNVWGKNSSIADENEVLDANLTNNKTDL